MKICLLADARSIHVRQLSHHLARLGHRIHVLTHKPHPLPWATVEPFRVPPVKIGHLRGWTTRCRRYVRGIFRAFDIVNVHFLADWWLRDVLADRRAGDARLIATAWGSDIVDPPGETPATCELIETRRTLLRGADAVTTCGARFAATVAQYAGLDADAIEVVPFGVDAAIFQRSAERGFNDPPRIGFFKGFRPVYGATTLLRAIPEILAVFPRARFELVGDGVERDECRAMAQRGGFDHAVEWAGRLDHAELPRRLGTWDQSVIPSVHEAFGVAALESQIMGVPVTASAVEGLHDTVRDGRTGLLFPARDSAALAGCVVRLLSDPGLRLRMGAAGREWVMREFEWTRVARAWGGLYARVREECCAMV